MVCYWHIFWKLRMCVMMMWQRSFSSHTHADEKFTDVAPAVRGVASSCVEDLAFPGEGGVESPCRPLVKSYTLAGVQHMCGTSNPPPSASRAVAAFQPQCADPLAAVFLRRLCERPTGR